jgi:ATP-dependent RNA helicase RhlE
MKPRRIDSVSFEPFCFNPRIAAAIRAAGYTTPTPIQQKAIPFVLQGRDLLGLAQTGTGKTAAFVLPILQRLGEHSGRKARCLILSPTRELAEQTHQTIATLGKKTGLRSTTIYGGVGKSQQIKALRAGVDMIVACPGRLLDHLAGGDVDLSAIETLVLDEADRMCDMGFLPDIRKILGHLPEKRQTLFFSATMPDEIRSLTEDILHDVAVVQIGMMAPAKTVSHALYPAPDGLKTRLLLAMLDRTPTGRVLIFTRTKRRASHLAEDLGKKGYRVAAMQGNMAQNRRQEAINGFRNGKYDLLVATDIAARGIDVTEISHVINYDMPDTVDAYTHRIGRTGRASQTGEAYTLTAITDEPMVRQIEKLLGKIERRRISDFDYGSFAPEQFAAGAPSGNPASRHRPEAAAKRAPSRSFRSSSASKRPNTRRSFAS